MEKQLNLIRNDFNYVLEQLPIFLDDINSKCELSAKFIKNKQFDMAQTVIADIAQKVDTVTRLLAVTHKVFDFEQKIGSGITLKQLEVHLLSIMKAIYLAHKKEDHIVLADLLEYELKDNLQQWKIYLIPNLKRTLLI